MKKIGIKKHFFICCGLIVRQIPLNLSKKLIDFTNFEDGDFKFIWYLCYHFFFMNMHTLSSFFLIWTAMTSSTHTSPTVIILDITFCDLSLRFLSWTNLLEHQFTWIGLSMCWYFIQVSFECGIGSLCFIVCEEHVLHVSIWLVLCSLSALPCSQLFLKGRMCVIGKP